MSNFYCAAPWRGLHINPRGDVKTCCAGDPNMLGNLNEQTIESILFGSKMVEIRQSIRQGQPHAYCYNCVQAERYGAVGERQWHNSANPDIDYVTAGTEYHYPVIVDVRWNTTCNLSCNYCNEWASSKWSALKSIPFRSGTRPYYEQVCDFLQQHHDHIKDVALVGGEPLLLPENERLLDVIPKNSAITLITNMSVNLESNKIFKKLAQRQNVGWSMSFDNVGKQFEYVRHGGSWDLLKNNLDMVHKLMQNNGHWGGIHAVYSIYNATNLMELTQFARSRGLAIQWQSLYQPECLDPTRLGPAVADLAQQHIHALLNSGLCLESEQHFFQTVLNNIQGTDDLRQQLQQHIVDIERIYHLDKQDQFAKLWPEIYNLL
jgi:MoaA/NifB/PqqE/SkfB family radical SAM enzyme